MNILYIKRDYYKKGLELKKLRKMPHQFRSRNKLVDQNGFFEGALYAAFNVSEISWHLLKHLPFRFFKKADAIIINQKSAITAQEIKKLAASFPSTPKILFSCFDKVEKLAPDDLLNSYDLIFKREPYKDLDRYHGLSFHNKAKIRPTMLSCPFIKIDKNEAADYCFKPNSLPQKHNKVFDFSFAGKGTSLERYLGCNAVADDDNLTSYLSIFDTKYNKSPEYVSPRIKNIKLSSLEYKQLINQTAVNFSPAGIGQFTYRHLELWYLGAFMLSSPSLNEYQLPGANPTEGIHYITYNNEDDLLAKVYYYLEREEERYLIAAAGQQLFSGIYNFKKHGQFIKDSIKAL